MKKVLAVIVCILAVIPFALAQSDCESMLEAADTYYSEGNYVKAAKMYKMIQEECDNNYGGAASKLRDCNHKLKEDADFEKCTSIAACNDYLENYPNGRYVDRVQQIRAGIMKANANAAEDDNAYQNCITKEDCLAYLKNYPYGRHVTQVKAMLSQFKEDEAYQNCITEWDCEAFLKAYPNSRYYSIVLARKNAMEEERLRKEKEAAATAYMNIRGVDFANAFAGGSIINAYGETLYLSEIRYLMPRVSYDGLLDETRLISIFCKIYRPDGTLMCKSGSPSGYSFSNIFKVQTGYDNLYELPTWGSDSDDFFVAGIYRFELWFENSRIYQTSFEVVDRETALSRGNWRTALRKCCDHVSYAFDNGSSYKGEYLNYRRSGLGMYSWKGIDYYVGSWESGERNGTGMEITPAGWAISDCPDCEYFIGEFLSDVKSGMGTCYDRYGNLIYFGNFKNDIPTQNYPMTGYDEYKLECIEYASGDYYVGETYAGKPHGKGVYIWSRGDMWYGDWQYGKRNGHGILMMYQGSVSSGTWKNDLEQ